MQRLDEAGTGMIGTALGATAFVAFLLLATHTLLGLYATSVVSAAAWDGARFAASHASNADMAAQTDMLVRRRLPQQRAITVEVITTADIVSVRVGAKRPSFVPVGLTTNQNSGRIIRTVHTRIEREQ